MKPERIPVGHRYEQLTNLLQGVITRQYCYVGSQYFFTLYPDNGPEAFETDRNGRYLVVRNCVAGTYTFYIEQNEKGVYTKEIDFPAVEPDETAAYNVISEIEGIHIAEEIYSEGEPYGLDCDPEPNEYYETGFSRIMLAAWLRMAGEAMVVQLMNEAIKEYHTTI